MNTVRTSSRVKFAVTEEKAVVARRWMVIMYVQHSYHVQDVTTALGGCWLLNIYFHLHAPRTSTMTKEMPATRQIPILTRNPHIHCSDLIEFVVRHTGLSRK
jgi:hypothetical protein